MDYKRWSTHIDIRLILMMPVLPIFSFLFFYQFCFAKNCSPNTIEITNQHLSCLQKSIFSQSLSTNLAQYQSSKIKCPDCSNSIIDIQKYSHLLMQKRMIVAYSDNSFGGKSLYVIFRNDPTLYKFWLYNLDNKQFQLRQVSAEKTNSKIANTISRLQKQSKFWQNYDGSKIGRLKGLQSILIAIRLLLELYYEN